MRTIISNYRSDTIVLFTDLCGFDETGFYTTMQDESRNNDDRNESIHSLDSIVPIYNDDNEDRAALLVW
eukprot:scaffold3241_cov125-Cylindrotheca_fusiformis.AAC.5